MPLDELATGQAGTDASQSLPPASKPGWFVSGINENCDEECSKHPGLTCGSTSIQRMASVNSQASLYPVLSSANTHQDCDSFADDPHPITPFAILNYPSGTSAQCEWRRENDDVTCEAKPFDNGYEYRRFCYCEQGTLPKLRKICARPFYLENNRFIQQKVRGELVHD